MGCNRRDHDTNITFLFGITWPLNGDDPKPLSEAERAVLYIYWRVIHRHFTLHDLRKISKIDVKKIMRDICYLLMTRILALQRARQLFYMRNKCAGERPNGAPKTSLPKKLGIRLSQIGTLDLHTGRISIQPALIKILKKHKVWRRFR